MAEEREIIIEEKSSTSYTPDQLHAAAEKARTEERKKLQNEITQRDEQIAKLSKPSLKSGEIDVQAIVADAVKSRSRTNG